jgi:hypothetical protein
MCSRASLISVGFVRSDATIVPYVCVQAKINVTLVY